MGGCMGTAREPSVNVGSGDPLSTSTGVAIGRNQPLNREKQEWSTEVPMTEGQLRSKRDEFWETAPAFEGRKEIWDALKAATEQDDVSMAQAIVDSANITLPTGSLTEAYDELGNNYKVPLYCINKPSNLLKNDDICEMATNDNEEEKDVPTGEAYPVKFRLSTGKEMKLQIYPSDTIHKLKKMINKREGVAMSRQRWFYSGRLLTDQMTVQDADIKKGYVVQIIVSEENKS
ncbi:ubiquitin domain-containing protein 2-like [Dendronephthya gigantea]|uniref:ubiquitin domain-containing protein 2-like n=1 Tax=Dendronephthya gigantea TaxID=151771 RepID=UPI00106A4E8E|nr:ubiquitin domain-containing protein 2-like [Dendronephthya gigantea]